MPADDKTEKFYLVDKDDNELGFILRGDAHAQEKPQEERIHRSVGIIILNEKNEMLMQKRSTKKDMDPGFWTFAAAGHVEYGDTYDDTAKKEMQEEIGVATKLTFITKKLLKKSKESEYQAIYKATISSDTKFILDEFEVEKVEWVHCADLKSFALKNPIVDWAQQGLKATGFL